MNHHLLRSFRRLVALSSVLVAALLSSACQDGSDTVFVEPAPTPLEQLTASLGEAARFFDPAGLEALLALEDEGTPVALLTAYNVSDAEQFAQYESAISQLWSTAGAEQRLRSAPFGQLIGERPMTAFRLLRFPNITLLRDAIGSGEMSDAMALLPGAVEDTAWALGPELGLPPTPTASYVNPDLLGVDEAGALSLLAAGNNSQELGSNVELIVDMVVSDDPSPFYMVNLIKHYEQANYPDGRETDLTGEEADAIYGNAVLPQLLAYNSLPITVIPEVTVLTREPEQWDRVAIVRYASRDALLTIFALNPASSEFVIHKEAGVEETLVWATSVESEQLPSPSPGPFYNFRYCEVLLGTFDESAFVAEVYNSIGLGTCPQEDWDALDAGAIASEFGADIALLNGIRFWVLDNIASTAAPTERVLADFGNITMFLAATVEVEAPPTTGEAAYSVAEVARSTVFTFAAGRQVYELHSPEGERFMMQSFSRVVDPEQQLGDLQFLNRRLALPPGWQFSTRVLQEEFQLRTVGGVARVVSDDLNNVYQAVPE